MSESKKISKRLQLKDSHPTAVKLSKLMDLADELGISLTFHSNSVVVNDKDRNQDLPPLFVEDIEGGSYWFNSFPFSSEYKMVYDNPAYLAQEKKEREEEDRLREEYRKADEERQAQELKEAAAKRAAEQERAERMMLATLKEKYES